MLNSPGKRGVVVVLLQVSMEETRKDKMNNTEEYEYFRSV